MTKGDHIKLIKPMGAFTNVGEICNVTNITQDGVISFRFGKNGTHLGCMSYNEFEKYFELVSEHKKQCTKWKKYDFWYDDLIGMILSILVYTFFSRMFDLMLPPVAKHSIVVA